MNIIPMRLEELRFMRDAYMNHMVNSDALAKAYLSTDLTKIAEYGSLDNTAVVLLQVEAEPSIQYDHSGLSSLFGTQFRGHLNIQLPFTHSTELIAEFQTRVVDSIEVLARKNSQTFVFVSESFVHGRHIYLLPLFETLQKIDQQKVKIVIDERLYKEYLEFSIHLYIKAVFAKTLNIEPKPKKNTLGLKFLNDFEDGTQTDDSEMFDDSTAFFPDSVFTNNADELSIKQDLIDKCSGRFTFSSEQLNKFTIDYLFQRVALLKAFYAKRYPSQLDDPNIQPNLLILRSAVLVRIAQRIGMPIDKNIFTEDYFMV